MPRKCIFCDGGPVTAEHVWPDWVRERLFPEVGSVRHVYAVDDEPRREWKAPPATLKARIVCGTCNHGWMGDLEAHVAPLLTPMARGKPVKVSTDDQLAIGRWALKTALVFQYVIASEDGVNPDFAHAFHDRLERAFPATYVWIGSSDATRRDALFRNRNLWPAEVGIIGQAHGFVSALRLHGVVLIAYMHTHPERNVRITGGTLRSLLPPSGILSWPFRRNVPVESFRDLTEAFIGNSPTD